MFRRTLFVFLGIAALGSSLLVGQPTAKAAGVITQNSIIKTMVSQRADTPAVQPQCVIDPSTGHCYSPSLCLKQPSFNHCDGQDPFDTGCNVNPQLLTTTYIYSTYFGVTSKNGEVDLYYSGACQSNYAIIYGYNTGGLQWLVSNAEIESGSSTCPQSCSVHSQYAYNVAADGNYTSWRTDMVFAPVDKARAYGELYQPNSSRPNGGNAWTKWCYPCA